MKASTLKKEPLHIGEIIRNGVLFNFSELTDNTINTDELLGQVENLFDLLEIRNVDFLLVGGIAMLQYVEGRNTEHVELIMSANDLLRLPEISIIDRDANFAHGQLDDLRVDILFTQNKLFQFVLKHHAQPINFIEFKINCATVEGLLLLKTNDLPFLYREASFARVGLCENDIATLLYEATSSLGTNSPAYTDKLLKTLSKYLSQADIGTLKDVLKDIAGRFDRFEKRLK